MRSTRTTPCSSATTTDASEPWRPSAWAASQEIPRDLAELMAGEVVFQERYPAFTDLLAGPDGTVWVRTAETIPQMERAGHSFDPT
jgi:hypothetical protein